MSRLTFTLIFSHCHLTLVCIEIPKCDCIARSMGGLYFMWVPSVRPEKCDSVENRFNVSDSVRPAVWKYSQESAVFSHVPVDVQVINARDTPPVSIGIVHMFYVVRALSLVARYHCLCEKKIKEVR